MVPAAGTGPDQSQKSGTPSRSPAWMAGAQVLRRPCCLPGAFAGSSREAEQPRPPTLVQDAGVAGGGLTCLTRTQSQAVLLLSDEKVETHSIIRGQLV